MGVRLTAELVESLPVDGRDKLVFDDLERGFGVRVTPAGAKIFVAQRRIDGKPVRTPIGRFPDMSVKKAREAARTILTASPVTAAPAPEPAPVPPPPAATFGEWVDTWLNQHVRVKLKPATIRDYEQIGEALKGRFGEKPLAALTRDDVRTLHAEMKATPRRANYYLQVISAVVNFAEHPSNPTKKVKRYREKQRERIMTPDELGRVFSAIDKLQTEEKLSVWACQALRFAIATGARPAEIRAVEWSFLNEDLKRVVLPDSKANRTRVIYCSDLAWTILTTTPKYGRFVFAGRDRDSAYQNLTLAWIKVRRLAKLPDVRLYDARHTFASEAAKAGHALPMIGQLLGHTVAATTARYVHLAGDPAAGAAQDVGDRLSAAMAKGKPDNVVAIGPKRKARRGKA